MKLKEKRIVRDTSKPLYETPEMVSKIYDHLTRLFRIIIYTNRVTGDMFTRHHSRFSQASNHTQTERTNDRGNQKKPIYADRITWYSFHGMINEVFGIQIVRLSITLRNPVTGEDVVYNSDDKIEINDEKKVIY